MQRFKRQRHVGDGAPVTGQRAGFLRSEDGSLIVFGLFVFLLMAVVAGMAVDFMRFETNRTRLQSTLDRAILAAASLDQSVDPELVVLDYFDKAGLGNFIDASLINVYENDRLIDDTYAGPSAEALVSRRVEASARMTIGTTFLKFSGIDFLGAPAAGTAEESASLTEISMVLDVSGSMDYRSASGNKKIYELREAAKKFINIVMCDPAHPERTSPCVVEDGKISVNLVPYASQVLVGEELLGYFDATDDQTVSSCVDFDEDEFETTRVSPTALIQRAAHIDPRSMNYRDSRYYNVYEPIEHLRTCQTESYREISAVNGDAADLRDRIDALEAGGATSIELGMKWGAALLDPAVQPVVEDLIDANATDGAYEGRPYDWEMVGRGNAKVVVLMTDGENTEHFEAEDNLYGGPSPVWRTTDKVRIDGVWKYLYSIYRASTDTYYWEHSRQWMDHAYGAGTYEECHNEWVRTSRYSGYWREVCTEVTEDGNGAQPMDYGDLWVVKPWVWWQQFDWLPSPGHEITTAMKNDRLKASCDAAKASGIIIYSVGFEVPRDSTSLEVLKYCASTPAHYFDANGLEISSDFSAIARDITKLRLTN